jgi:hypothetical protein
VPSFRISGLNRRHHSTVLEENGWCDGWPCADDTDEPLVRFNPESIGNGVKHSGMKDLSSFRTGTNTKNVCYRGLKTNSGLEVKD